RADLVHHLLGGTLVGPLARHRSAEIVDDDLGAVAGEQQRVLATDAPAGPRDDRDAPLAELGPQHTPPVIRLTRRPLVERTPSEIGEFRGVVVACEAGGPMDEPIAQSSADAPVSSEAGTRPRHFASAPTLGVVPTGDPPPPRRRRWVLPVLLAPVVLVVAVVVAWAVDTSSGVLRNVRLAGVDIGGLSEAELAPRLRELAEEFGATPVEIVVGDRSYGSTASVLGLMVDQDRTADAALEVGN